MDNKFYTYLHLNAKDGRPFYVGKGKQRKPHSQETKEKMSLAAKLRWFKVKESYAPQG